MAEDALTPKQARFVAAYLETGNATAAYRTAYDAAERDVRSVQSSASRLLKHRLIAPRIAEQRARLAARTEQATERLGVTVERLVEEYARIAFCELGALATGAKGPVGAKITVTGKLAALDSLARLLGLFDKEKPRGEEQSPLNLTITIA